MDILQNNLPDEQFFEIQSKLIMRLKKQSFVSWKQIQKTCKTLLEAYPESYSAQYGNFPEYKLFMPLLRNGICEVAKENEKTGYVALPELADSEETLNPLLLLNNFPCINDLINGFKKEDSLELKFKCNLEDKYSYKPFSEKSLEIGIYRPEDKVYAVTLLFDGKAKRIIPDYNKNPDAINVARCFARCSKNQQLFTYHKQSKELSTCFYSELPILVSRALILFDKSQLKNAMYNYPLSRNQPYHNVDEKAVEELERIFGANCIEVKND